MGTNSIDYPVSLRALEKWDTERLEQLSGSGDSRHYRFLYNGSTCTNGGTPFSAYLHVEIRERGKGRIIGNAWIEIPETEREAAAGMCAARSHSSGADAFFDTLALSAKFCGRALEDVILEDKPVNYAGCFCSPPMVRDKWNMALSAVHFREEKES